MADFYCDHGAHSFKATFNATFNGWTMDVTSVTSGKISVGSHVYATGVPFGMYVISINSGSGGVGNYNLSRNISLSNRSCTSNYGQPHPSVPPTWGQAQEGDGTSLTTGSPATVSIDLSAASASSGSILVLGALVSGLSGSGAALVANAVSAINSSSTLISAQLTNWATPQLKDAVFARVGTPSTTLEIMTRAASAVYNGKTVTTSGFTGGTFGPYSFSGGVGGCWSWLWNIHNGMWSSVNASMYGVLSGFNSSGQDSHRQIAGSWSDGDTVWIRGGKSFHVQSWQNSRRMQAAGSPNNPVRITIDTTGSKWTADAGNTDLSIKIYIVGDYGNFGWNSGYQGYYYFDFPRVSSGGYSFNLIEADYAYNSNNSGVYISGIGPSRYKGISLKGTSRWVGQIRCDQGADGQLYPEGMEVATRLTEFIDMELAGPAAQPFILRPQNSYTNGFFKLISSVISNAGNASAHPGTIEGTAGNNCMYMIYIDACKYTGFVPGSRLLKDEVDWNQGNIYLRNCDMGAINSWESRLASELTSNNLDKKVVITKTHGSRDFFIETLTGIVEWNSISSYPTLNAKLQDGTTPWSIRFKPSTSSRAPMHLHRALILPRITKVNTLGSGVRTITVELLSHKSITDINSKTISASMEYVDTSGSVKIVDSFDFSGLALATSSATWTNMQVDPADGISKPTYVDGGTQFYNRYKVTLVTPTAVMADSEVGLYLKCGVPVSTAVQSFFIDPSMVLS